MIPHLIPSSFWLGGTYCKRAPTSQEGFLEDRNRNQHFTRTHTHCSIIDNCVWSTFHVCLNPETVIHILWLKFKYHSGITIHCKHIFCLERSVNPDKNCEIWYSFGEYSPQTGFYVVQVNVYAEHYCWWTLTLISHDRIWKTVILLALLKR